MTSRYGSNVCAKTKIKYAITVSGAAILDTSTVCKPQTSEYRLEMAVT